MSEGNRPLFSIVIPAYNAAEWLGATLDSWAAQTLRNFEVIVVDDGSRDATADVAESYRDRMDIRVFREKPSGAPARPCNVGIRAARGEVIVHCDADDLALPDRLEGVLQSWEAAGRRECLMFSDFSEVDTLGKELRPSALAQYSALQHAGFSELGNGQRLLEADVAFTAMLEGSFIRPCAAATSKSVLEKIGGFDEKLRNGQDYDLYVRIAREFPMVWSRRVLASYRISPSSISFRPASQLVPSRLAIFKKLLTLPLTDSQVRLVKRSISRNYEALAYEQGDQGRVIKSLNTYLNAFINRPSIHLMRGAAVSVAKFVLGRTHPQEQPRS